MHPLACLIYGCGDTAQSCLVVCASYLCAISEGCITVKSETTSVTGLALRHAREVLQNHRVVLSRRLEAVEVRAR